MGAGRNSVYLIVGEKVVLKVAFRADASLVIGTGHVMRCLTLADMLRASGVECFFLSREHGGHLHSVVKQRGYPLINLGDVASLHTPNGSADYEHWLGVSIEKDIQDSITHLHGMQVDWLIVDHYGLDERWERALRRHCGRLLVIDDLANRRHFADILVDQNFGKNNIDYNGLVPDSCVLMIGAKYALLRHEFAKLRGKSLKRRAHSQLKNLLITMGGVDIDNKTGLVLRALAAFKWHSDQNITVVMGANAPWLEEVFKQALEMPVSTDVVVNVADMANLMYNADLAIGAAGSTAWERCCLGLPTLQLVLADNQRLIADALNGVGAAIKLDEANLINCIHKHIGQFSANPALLTAMSLAAAQVTDGCGAELVVNKMKELAA